MIKNTPNIFISRELTRKDVAHKSYETKSENLYEKKMDVFSATPLFKNGETAKCLEILSDFVQEAPKSLKVLAGGENDVFLVNDSWIVRIPKHKLAKAANQREHLLLNVLKNQITHTKIPDYNYWLQEKGMGAYKAISGIPLSQVQYMTFNEEQKKELARVLAQTIHEIHSTPEQHQGDCLAIKTKEYLNIIKKLKSYLRENTTFNKEELAQLKDDVNNLNDAVLMKKYAPVLIHGDLHCDNILIDSNKKELSGLIDFSEAKIALPFIDFFSFYRIDKDLAERIIIDYAKLQGLNVADFKYTCEAWSRIHHAKMVIENTRATQPLNIRRLARAGAALRRLWTQKS